MKYRAEIGSWLDEQVIEFEAADPQAAYIFAMDETNKRGIPDGYVVQIFETTWDEICVYSFMSGFCNTEYVRCGLV